MANQMVQRFDAAGRLFGRTVRVVRRLPRRTLWIALATAGVGGGLFLGWDWLAAAGFGSVLLGLLPCAAMCAAGLCAGRHGTAGGCHGGTESGTPTVHLEREGRS